MEISVGGRKEDEKLILICANVIFGFNLPLSPSTPCRYAKAFLVYKFVENPLPKTGDKMQIYLLWGIK